MMSTDTAQSSRLQSRAFQLGPVVSSALAALSSLAFFRTWVEFSVGEHNEPVKRTGLELARELGGPLASWPTWAQLTPVLLILIVAVSAYLIFKQTRRARITSALFLVLAGACLIGWSAWEIADFMNNISRIRTITRTSVAFTPWWWLYEVSVAVIIAVGVVQAIAHIRAREEQPDEALTDT